METQALRQEGLQIDGRSRICRSCGRRTLSEESICFCFGARRSGSVNFSFHLKPEDASEFALAQRRLLLYDAPRRNLCGSRSRSLTLRVSALKQKQQLLLKDFQTVGLCGSDPTRTGPAFIRGMCGGVSTAMQEEAEEGSRNRLFCWFKHSFLPTKLKTVCRGSSVMVV